MTATCVHCGKRKGSRSCPALAGTICSRCCGADRLVHISCPDSCVHLRAHEPFQMQRQGERYRDAWRHELRGASKDDALALHLLERCILAAVSRERTADDEDVDRALHDLEGRLSPIELVSGAASALARALHGVVEEVIANGAGTRDVIRSAIPRALRILEVLRDGDSPRAFLRGLTAWVAAQPRPQASTARSDLIVTPDDLRAAREEDDGVR